jgi:hypothetical protein
MAFNHHTRTSQNHVSLLPTNPLHLCVRSALLSQPASQPPISKKALMLMNMQCVQVHMQLSFWNCES